jgi:peroxiredoxin
LKGRGSEDRLRAADEGEEMFKSSPRLLLASLAAASLVFGQAFARVAPARRAAAVQFELRTVDGGSITSEQLRGDVVVLAFGASWLPLSRAQVTGVQGLADEYRARDLRVYWVSTDSDKPQSKNYATDDQLRSFARRNGLKIAVLRDPDGGLFKTLGVERNQLPSIVIIDRQGEVAERIGGLDPGGDLVKQLSDRLNRLLSTQ